MASSILTCLFSALLSACMLQAALSRPLVKRSQSQEQMEHITFVMSSRLTGKYISLQEDGSVDALGSISECNAEWRLLMTENGFRFENVAYRGHYLTMALFGDGKAHLLGHDISQSLTISEEESSSGSGASEAAAEATVASTAVIEEQEDQEGDKESLEVISDWMFEGFDGRFTRFALVSEAEDCFLAVDSNGLPHANLCSVQNNDPSAHFKLSPIFSSQC